MRGLRVPLPIPAQTSSHREFAGERQLSANIESQLAHRASVYGIAHDKRLLVAPWRVVQIVGQRVKIELPVEIGLVSLSCRIVGKPAAYVQDRPALGDRKIVVDPVDV